MTDNRIVISFSESMDKKSIADAVFISPRPKDSPTFSWKKNNLYITLVDTFSTNTTYVVTIGTAIKDIRGNKLENSYSFAFSTGEIINAGAISGFIFENDKPASGITIGLYDFSVADSIEFLDSLYPPYLTQSGKNGEFILEYLPDGEYLALAYDDKNKNQLLNYPAEKFGLPDKVVFLSKENLSQELKISLISADTSKPAIISVGLTKDNLIKTRFSKTLSCRSVNNHLDQIELVSDSAESISFPAVSVKESGEDETNSFNFYFGQLRNDRYRLRIGAKLFRDVRIDSSFIYGEPFDIQILEDSTLPQLENFTLNGKTIYPDEAILKFDFSEPIELLSSFDSSIQVYDTDDNRQVISCNWIDNFKLSALLNNSEWGKSYYVIYNEKAFADLSGNLSGDSITVFKFSIYNFDSLGEISGEIKYGKGLDSNSIAYLTAQNVSGDMRLTKAVNKAKFNFTLPSGKYFLSGFIDKNANGAYNAGSLRPFRLAETISFSPDTIRVRTRFETSGLMLEFK